jgi:hypothetical protein
LTYIRHEDIHQVLVESVVGVLDVVVNVGKLEEAVPRVWVHLLFKSKNFFSKHLSQSFVSGFGWDGSP